MSIGNLWLTETIRFQGLPSSLLSYVLSVLSCHPLLWRVCLEGLLSSFSSGLSLSLSSFVTAFFYRKLGKEQEHLLKGEVLAHWHYADDLWKKYAETEYRRETSSKKALFLVVAAWSLLFGILFPLFDRESGIFVTYALGALIVLLGIVAYLSAVIPYRRALSQGGEAIISRTGVYLNGQLHSWNVAGMTLESVAYIDTEEPPYIEFVYSGAMSEYPVRVPVPVGEEEKAQEIVREFKKKRF